MPIMFYSKNERHTEVKVFCFGVTKETQFLSLLFIEFYVFKIFNVCSKVIRSIQLCLLGCLFLFLSHCYFFVRFVKTPIYI